MTSTDSDLEDLSHASYSKKQTLAAVIYLHRISDNRVDECACTNFQRLTGLCAQKAIPNVVIITTMWKKVSEKEGTDREEELKQKFWDEMLANGCRTERFEDTYESAWDITGSLEVEVQTQVSPSASDHIVA